MTCGHPQHSNFCACDKDQFGLSRAPGLDITVGLLRQELDKANAEIARLKKALSDIRSNCSCDTAECANCFRADAALSSASAYREEKV